MTKPAQDGFHKTLRLLLSWDEKRPLPFSKDPNQCELGNITIVENPSRQTHKALSRDGYLYQRRFALLPSRRKLRWLLPLEAKGPDIDGLQIYMPHGPVSRIVKMLIVKARATGWHGWVRDTVVVASRLALPVEALLSAVTEEKKFVLSLSPGTPGAFQKLTVQVMRTDGSILGYLKLPMTDAASKRL